MEPIPAADWMPATVENSKELEDFEAVVRLYWPKVFRFLLASLRDRDAAESLAQDCFWKAYRARKSFRGDSSLSTWLMRIAANLVRDHFRNRRLAFGRLTKDSAAALAPRAGCCPTSAFPRRTAP